MPLFLHQSFAPAHHIQEILRPLVERHIGFHLSDRFLILTPDEESRHDLEQELLSFAKLGNILIGRSIQTLPGFLQGLLFHHPNPFPQAGNWLQRRALNESIRENKIRLPTDPIRLQGLLWEIRRLQYFQDLSAGQFRAKNWRELASTWESILISRYGAWNHRRATQEAWEILSGKPIPELNKLEEIYFLGFLIPDPVLLGTLERLQERYPNVAIHLFIPPVSRLVDSEGIFEPALKKLRSWAGDRIASIDEPGPEKHFIVYPTALHEHREISLCLAQQSAGRILVPERGQTREFLEREFLSRARQATGERLRAGGTTVIFEILDQVPSNGWDSPESFEEYFQRILPKLETMRNQVAQYRDIYSMRCLEELFHLLQEWRSAESQQPNSKSSQEWAQAIREEIQIGDFASSRELGKQSTLRAIERPGILSKNVVYLPGLIEGHYPPQPRPFLLEPSFIDKLRGFESDLVLERAYRQAKQSAIFSYSEFSLSGKVQQPSLILSIAKEYGWLEKKDVYSVWSTDTHPFLAENVERDRLRQAGVLNPDSGQFESLDLEEHFWKKIRKRPLSGTYLDDYAKCPWRFFAKWHLKLKDDYSEAMELKPKDRGRFQHELLEILFRQWQEAYFALQQHPENEAIIATLETQFQQLGDRIREIDGFRDWPPALLNDQLKRLRRQIARVLETEREHWEKSEAKLFPRYLEWPFGLHGSPPAMFKLDDEREVPLAGAIDRIDVSADGGSFLVLDYKSSRTGELSRELREHRSFQLWIYIHAVKQLLMPQGHALGGVYWDLKELKRNQGLLRKDSMRPFLIKAPRGDSYLVDEAFAEFYDHLESSLKKALLGILRGDYSLQPPACAGERCDFFTICRYADRIR